MKQLTKPQKQLLLHIIKQELVFLQEIDSELKVLKKELYNKSIPTDKTTQPHFEYLNEMRTFSRQTKSRINKLAHINKALKTEIRNT